MTDPTRIEQVFLDALNKADADRPAFVAEACSADSELRREVERLLAALPRVGKFLEEPLGNALSPTEEQRVPSVAIGTLIAGRYKLLEPIGEGGMGTVWMAQQTEPVKRMVAVKLIKAGMDSAQVIARFEAERQALAMMDHVSIARVFDGGATEAGRPYFVMELVRGVPITDFCDQAHLPPHERLELFMQVCLAVQHAHQKGIIHRDLKPSNVLVSAHDGKPAVKVIDFGVAKAVGQPLTDKTLFTGFAQLVGTPLYMSPEQAAQSPDIDTRSDIYALGVLLYELLTGTTPFDKERFRLAAYDEIRRIIREEEPPRPSTRLAQSTDTLPSISAQRQMEPAKLTRQVRGELDWIVMKALEKDRGRRYESAAAIAADVRRYLADEPVQACPPSAGYKLRKFARRNRTGVAAAAVVCLAALLAVGGLGVSYARVREALSFEMEVREREQQALYLQRIKTAARELAAGSAGSVGRAERSLEDCPVNRRGWEWDYLKRRRYQEPRVHPAPDAALTVGYSPYGRYLVTACADGSVAVWDTWTWKPLSLPRGHKGHVYTVAFSPDERYLASGGSDKQVLVWDLSTGKVVHTLLGHTDTIQQVAFGPGGQIASAAEDGTVRLWDVATGRELRVFAEHLEPVRGLAFTAGGQVVSAGASGEVKVWDPATGAVSSTRRAAARWVSAMAFHASSGRLALAGRDGTVELWDSPAAGETRTLDGHATHVTGLAFSPDGSRLVSAGDDRALKLWDTVSGQEALAIDIGDSTPIGVAFAPDGRQLAVACGQRHVKICDGTPLSGTEKKDELFTFAGHTDLVLRVAFDLDGHRLVSASKDGTAMVWDLRTGREPLIFRGHTGIVSAAAFSPDGNQVASAGWDGKVLVWNAVTGEVVLALVGDAGVVHDVAFSPDGLFLASAHASGTVILWDARTRANVHGNIAAHGYEAVSVAFDRDSKRLATAGGRDHTAKVWNVATGKEAFALETETSQRTRGRIWSIAFSPDGKLLATVGHGNATGTSSVLLWDAVTGKYLHPLEAQAGRNCSVAFSPDSQWVASGGWDETVRAWEVTTRRDLRPLRGHAGPALSVTFSPDGRLLASCGGYKGRGEIKVWDATQWKKD